MNRAVVLVLGFLLSAGVCAADDIKDAIGAAEKGLDEASGATDAKQKAEKYAEVRAALTKTIDNIKASKKIFADEEIAPLYVFRGVCNYETREYEQANEDLTLAAKLIPNKITPWLNLSRIKSSAPVDRLRNGKESLAAAENAIKALKLFAAQETYTPFGKFQQSNEVLKLNQECVLAVAAAHAELGNFKEAIRIIKDGDEKVVKEYLDCYRDGKPYRLPAKP